MDSELVIRRSLIRQTLFVVVEFVRRQPEPIKISLLLKQLDALGYPPRHVLYVARFLTTEPLIYETKDGFIGYAGNPEKMEYEIFTCRMLGINETTMFTVIVGPLPFYRQFFKEEDGR